MAHVGTTLSQALFASGKIRDIVTASFFEENELRIISISKGNGKTRTIYSPNDEERAILAPHVPVLRDLQEHVLDDCVHGFRVKRSPITNAIPHLNMEYTLSFDLENFFDSVTYEHLKCLLPVGFRREVKDGGVLYQRAPRQGLPTSPFVANIAAAAMDRDILASLCLPITSVVYTRYADDLSFSWCGDRSLHTWLRTEVKRVVESHRFKLAKGKTHLQSSKAGRRVVCGVAVDHELHARRDARRRLRAASHRCEGLFNANQLADAFDEKAGARHHIKLAHRQMNGLRAWCSMKIPQEKA